MITTKKQKVIDALKAGNALEATKLAKAFKIELTKEQQAIVARAFEMSHSPAFYEQLGFNAADQLQKAETILREVYAEHL
jgi:hypothetical protein